MNDTIFYVDVSNKKMDYKNDPQYKTFLRIRSVSKSVDGELFDVYEIPITWNPSLLEDEDNDELTKTRSFFLEIREFIFGLDISQCIYDENY
jgi:hypothetical protein